ncbi:MAG: phosphomannomutase [Haliea sp.]|mgnify:CR=1 FL=1|nr:phosphomannomutase [Haliea sp.]MAL94835.1 phosphomannomutase [Haliea sp.]|tara:strand:+ start:111265 stop:113667 length:2403 start_codon:yes stop_codon:yes gene_type:complete
MPRSATASPALTRTLLLAAVIAVGPLLAGVAWLALVREPQLTASMQQNLNELLARQQAEVLHTLEQGLRERLDNAARSPRIQASVTASPEERQVIEQELRLLFPELESLRLIPVDDLGSAPLREGMAGLRNNIEIDLVRRAAAGEPPAPEIYPVGEAVYTSLALLVAPGQASPERLVLLASIDDRHLFRPLGRSSQAVGQVTIRQRYGEGGREVLQLGREIAPGATPARYHSVPGSNWEVGFATATELVEELRPGLRDWLTVAGCGLIGALCALWLLLRRLAGLSPVGSVPAATAGAVAQPRQRVSDSPGEPASLDDLFAAAEADGPEADDDNPVGLPTEIFRAYDLRGHAERDLTDTVVDRVGRAIGTLAAEKNQAAIIVASDGRRSSPRIRETLTRALLATGRDVIDIGVVPTPLMHYATHHLDCSSGVMVTGSHNPPADNGLKIVIKGQTLAAGMIQQLRQSAELGNFCVGEGKLSQRDVVAAYLDEVVDDIVLPAALRVVVDAGNGATSEAAPALFSALGCEVLPLYCELDGDFPNRPPDTSREENLADLAARVVDQGADLGVAFDGDGDRLAVVSASGRILRTDELLMVLARDVLSRNPGTDVVFDVKCSRELANRIVADGGRPVLCKTGHAFMKQKVAETGALLGGEFSGHVFYGERWYGFDDALYAAARLAEILSSQGVDLDSLLADIPPTVSTPELLLPVPEERKFSLIRQFADRADFPDATLNTLDGLRVDYREGWGLVRASNTTAALTARFEASDPAQLASIMAAFRQQLAALDPPVALPDAPGTADSDH